MKPRHIHPQPVPVRPKPPSVSWWCCDAKEFSATAKREAARMTSTTVLEVSKGLGHDRSQQDKGRKRSGTSIVIGGLDE